MATAVGMGEADDIHTREENIQDGVVTNGEVCNKDVVEKEKDIEEVMEVELGDNDEEEEEEAENGVKSVDNCSDVADSDSKNGDAVSIELHELDAKSIVEDAIEDLEDKDVEMQELDIDDDKAVEIIHEIDDKSPEILEQEFDDKSLEIHDVDDEDDITDDDINEIVDDEEEDDESQSKDMCVTETTIELNDSGDVVIVDQSLMPRENGDSHSKSDNDTTIISDEEMIPETPMNSKKRSLSLTPRRSTRNVHRQQSYVESEKEEEESESDIEEILPEDPLAVGDPLRHEPKKIRLPSSTIVVKDTKRLVEIAAKSNPGNCGKKEPTLVIIDTNSILSGRGPVPILQKPTISPGYSPVLPAAVPAQGVYPPNMRATITPIPMSNNANSSSSSSSVARAQIHTSSTATTILPSLTDDMFVVEAPSFIVPYVYEKPPIKEFKDFLSDMAKEIAERKKLEEEELEDDEDDEEDVVISGETKKDDADVNKPSVEITEKKAATYFDNPLCKFFIDIGYNLVQEFVQTDLLKQQKRKRDREQGQNSQTNNTIKSLLKSLEYSKENNLPYKVPMKKCEFCSFKTESALAMSFHLETPHMKNYIYKCNFCPYEVRSPHDILFHMEAEHAVRGRLERAPAFHQCPNCPFEDNQKGKLSRHLVACMRKFRPEKNLEPPVDWEPPAKIPRVPRMKQSSLGNAAAMYQMAKSSQYQFMNKMQQPNALNRGRGRPSLGSTKTSQQSMIRPNPAMVYKQTMSGGSVLVPTNYQLSGNQLYQVVGGQDMGGRIGPGPMALVPNISATANSVSMQQQQSAANKKPVHQPSISITPLPRGTSSTGPATQTKPGDSNSKNSFVICEICDGYIKDLEQLRNHMQWIHKVKIHPKMIYNRPPLNCQKCQFRFFTDQGLERHLLGSHGLVTSSMQDAANKSKDSGRCPVCGRVYQWKLLNHVARDHNMTLKPAHLSYKCTVCTATFGMYKLFENHVYSAHSVVAKRVMDKKQAAATTAGLGGGGGGGGLHAKNETLLRPLKINDEITIIPQQSKASSSKEGSPSSTSKTSAGGPSTSKSFGEANSSATARRTTPAADN